MSAQNDEDDRIDAAIADADWCHECDVPIGVGRCGGCIAVASIHEELNEVDYEE
jgi:predicted RNA-binding protein with PUA domain